jgi:hypothetical protein
MRRVKEDRYIREINEPVCRRMIFPAEIIGRLVLYTAGVAFMLFLGWALLYAYYHFGVWTGIY